MRKCFTLVTMTAAVMCIAGMSQPLGAQSKQGTTAAPFLGIGMGARSVAMGGASVSEASDVSALYWNPAAIARLGKPQLGFVNTQWLIGTQINWAGATIPVGNYGTVGVGITVLNYGTMDITSLDRPDGTGETFTANDLALQLSYARNLTDKFSLGASVKYVTQRIYNVSAATVAFDVGLLFNTGLLPNGLRVGAVIANFGGDMQLSGRDLLVNYDQTGQGSGGNVNTPAYLDTERRNLPLFFRVGVSYDALKSDAGRLTVAADGLNPTDNAQSLNLGGEYSWREIVFVRAGYNALFQQDSETGLTFGAGLRYGFNAFRFRFDYTYQTFGRLNAPQWIGVGLEF